MCQPICSQSIFLLMYLVWYWKIIQTFGSLTPPRETVKEFLASALAWSSPECCWKLRIEAVDVISVSFFFLFLSLTSK